MNEIWHAFTVTLQNQFLSGGILLMVLGSLVALCRRLPARAWQWFARRVIVTVDVSNDDPIFQWLSVWLAAQPYSKRARSLTASSKRDVWGNLDTENGPARAPGSAPSLPDIIFSPAPGNHLFLYKRRLVWLQRERKEPQGDDAGGRYSLMRRESFTLRVLGRRQSVARSLIEDARRMAVQERKTKVDIFVSASDYWHHADSRDPRPFSSVYLPDGEAEGILADVRTFLAGKEWYAGRGIPYRRGYLFHGIPGSGKTSLICALAGELRMSLYILNLSSSKLSDSGLNQLLTQVPPRSMVLLEDVDAAFAERKKSDDVSNGVTFSGLLNALDGAATKEGWLVFMTTNHKGALDPALVRPGRADVHVEFRHATRGQAARMYSSFFGGTDAETAEIFGACVAEAGMSMAEVQQHLMTYRQAPEEAIVALTERQGASV
jgi:chaperone BCS1